MNRESKNRHEGSSQPTVDFGQRIAGQPVAPDRDATVIPTVELDVPIASAKDFLAVVGRVANLEGAPMVWKEVQKMAEDRVDTAPNSFWYLGELSKLAEFYQRNAAGSGIVKVIMDYINKCTSSVDWKELIKFSSRVTDEDSFRTACSHLGCLDNSIKSVMIRQALADIVKDQNGVIVGEDLGFDPSVGVEEAKVAAVERADLLMSRQVYAERRVLRMEAVKMEEEAHRESVYNKLALIPDQNGLLMYHAKEWANGRETDDELRENLKAHIQDAHVRDIALKATEELDIIEKIEDTNNKRYTYLAKDFHFGDQVLIPEGTECRIVKEEDEVFEVVFGNYGLGAVLPKVMFKEDKGEAKEEKEAKVIYAHDYELLTKGSQELLSAGKCPVCVEAGYGEGFLVGYGAYERKVVGRDLNKLSVPELEDLIDNWMEAASHMAPKSPQLSFVTKRLHEAEAILQDKRGVDNPVDNKSVDNHRGQAPLKSGASKDLYECIECGSHWDNVPLTNQGLVQSKIGLVQGAFSQKEGLSTQKQAFVHGGQGVDKGLSMPVIGFLRQGTVTYSVVGPDGKMVHVEGLATTEDVRRWLGIHRESLRALYEEKVKELGK